MKLRMALGALIAVLVGLCAGAQSALAAPGPPVSPGSTYLALGDSVTFGYQEPNVMPPPNYQNAASFHGYPEQLGPQLKLTVVNAACPGETSDSLINHKAKSNGCENVNGQGTGYRGSRPLHVRYKGSQLAFAIKYLKRHKNVRLVTLLIGANDVFLCERVNPNCFTPSVLNAVFAKVQKNVHRIVSAIRNQARYRGQLLVGQYYSTDYTNALLTGGAKLLNQAQAKGAKPFRVGSFDGFGVFRKASQRSGDNPCMAGLITQLYTNGAFTGCGVHPTYAGSGLLAQAVAKAARLK